MVSSAGRREPADRIVPEQPVVVYVSRFPPSPSGVARYAADFRAALAVTAAVREVELPPDPASSQTLRTIVQAQRQTRAAARAAGPDATCWVEIAGRGIAELLLVRRARTSFRRCFVTVHDAPAVTGGVGYLSLLDRPGLRRVAAVLSRRPGRWLENHVLNGCDGVFVLSDKGADSLAMRLRRRPQVVRFVVHVPVPPREKRAEVYLPGHIGSPLDVSGLERLVRSIQQLGGRLVCGAADPAAAAVLDELSGRFPDVVQVRGFQSESDIDEQFRRSLIVVRPLPGGGRHGANHAAVSGPVARALAHGCVVVTNDLRGTAEYLAPTYAVTTREPAEVFDEAVRLLQGAPDELREKSRLAREFAERELSVEAVGAVLAEVLAR